VLVVLTAMYKVAQIVEPLATVSIKKVRQKYHKAMYNRFKLRWVYMMLTLLHTDC